MRVQKARHKRLSNPHLSHLHPPFRKLPVPPWKLQSSFLQLRGQQTPTMAQKGHPAAPFQKRVQWTTMGENKIVSSMSTAMWRVREMVRGRVRGRRMGRVRARRMGRGPGSWR